MFQVPAFRCWRIRFGVRRPEPEVCMNPARIRGFGFWRSASGEESSESRAHVPSPTEVLRLIQRCCILAFRCLEPTPTRFHTLVTGLGASLPAGRVALV